MAVAMTLALEARGITVHRGGTIAVRGVSLSVPQGSWFGIIGANGSGKTSLLRGLGGRVACEIESCRVLDFECADDPAKRASVLGFMVPSEHLPGPLTCSQLFALVEPDSTLWRPRIGALWGALGIDGLLARRVGTCSAGMRQRIAVAAAFLTDSAVIILDEPFNWLDPVAAIDLRAALRAQVDRGLSLVTALHDMISLLACDQGLLLGLGRAVEVLDAEDIARGRQAPFAFEDRLIERLRSHSEFS
jgi:ABC-2 type transport system ATP-binding protein